MLPPYNDFVESDAANIADGRGRARLGNAGFVVVAF